MEIEFTPIETESWYPREIFHYFSKIAPTTYSITSKVDVTNMVKTIKEIKGSIIKFVGFRVSDILPSAFIHYL